MKILIANVGSTSFKFKLFDMQDESVLADGKIENIGYDESAFQLSSKQNQQSGVAKFPEYADAVHRTIQFLTDAETGVLASLDELNAIGFKTVHGKGIRECRYLDESVLNAMEEYTFLAPAHNPPYINAIRIFAKLVPGIPLVGLFEPAFHRTIPDYAYTFGIPYELAEKHSIRKYGFHGASHRFIAENAPVFSGMDPKNVRLISCHLGGSSSICAVKNGKSIDTSMAFSPQSGLLNAKRCGDLDPFVTLFLQKAENMSVDEVADLLNTKSGLLGISGVSGDMKQIIDAAETGNKQAQLAVDTFCYGIQKYIGSYFIALGGLDLLVFTGGIGERGTLVRQKVVEGLTALGAELDNSKNENVKDSAIISTASSKITVAVVPTNEEKIVAVEVKELLEKK